MKQTRADSCERAAGFGIIWERMNEGGCEVVLGGAGGKEEVGGVSERPSLEVYHHQSFYGCDSRAASSTAFGIVQSSFF